MNISIASLVSLYHYDSFQRCIVEKLKITSILLKLETLRVVNGPQQVTNIASSRQDAQPLQIIQFCSRKEQVSLWVQTMQDLWHLYAFVTFEVNWLISWFWRIEVVKGLDSLLSISSLCVINVSSYGRIVAIQVYPLAFHVWMKCCNACSGTLTSRSIDGWCQLGKSRYFISRLECPGPGRTWGFLVRSCMEDRSLASWYSHLDVIEFQGLTGTSCVVLPGSESLFAQQLLSRSSALISVRAKMAVKSQITTTLFSESNLEHGPLQNLSVCEGVFGLAPFLRNVRAPFGLVWCERKPPATFRTGGTAKDGFPMVLSTSSFGIEAPGPKDGNTSIAPHQHDFWSAILSLGA